MTIRATIVLVGVLALASTGAGCGARHTLPRVPPAPADTSQTGPPPAEDTSKQEKPTVLEQQRKSYTPPP